MHLAGSTVRVLFVHDVIGDLGGAEAFVRHSARALRARGAQIALLHGPSTGSNIQGFHDIFCDRFDWSSLGPTTAVNAALAWQPHVIFMHKLAELSVLEYLVNGAVPIVRMVHDHAMYCQRESRYFPWNRSICTRKAGYACALTCGIVRHRGGVLPVRFAWPGRKLRELALCRRCVRHIVVTDFMRRELLLHNFNPHSITIMPPVPRPAPAGFTPTYRDQTLLFVGQIIRGKGLDVLIRALPHMRQSTAHLKVIGDGGHRAACEALVTKLGLRHRVTFTGWVAQEQLIEHYADARVGVVPSVWPEPIATIGLEFMQHALPVVGFDAGGISDWLHDGDNGFLVPLWDLPTLAERLDRLLENRELAQRMGESGLAQAHERHVSERAFDELTQLLTNEAHR